MVALSLAAFKIVFSGTRTGGEEWSTGLWMTALTDDLPSPEDMNTIASNSFVDFSTAWIGGFNTAATSNTDFTTCRAYFYPAGSLSAAAVGELSGEVAPGSSTNRHPYQVGLVCSLRTTLPTRTGRGRMYLPLDGLTIDAAGGQVNATQVALIGTRMQSLVQALNANTDGFTGAVAVASHVTGNLQIVTEVRTNSLPDIQRRRQNKLIPVTTDIKPITFP